MRHYNFILSKLTAAEEQIKSCPPLEVIQLKA